MSRLNVCVLVACCVALPLAACSPPPTPPPPETITVTSDAMELAADGKTTAHLTVSRPTAKDVALVASHGTFQDTGTKTTTLTGGTGSAVLVSCDSRLPAACAGVTRVAASSDDGASGAVTVKFTQIEICGNGKDDNMDGKSDCADPTCLGQKCTRPAMSSGSGICVLGGACLCDCNDPLCRPTGNNQGQACDTRGNLCSNLLPASDGGMVANCSTCSGNDGGAQSVETSCGDGKDNDCNGLIDCQDPSCAGIACTKDGKRCTAATQTCDCPGTEAQGEVTCGDGVDNDCNGLTDCADPNCQPVSGHPARACNMTGSFCTSGAVCACGGNGGTPEAKEGATSGTATCGDGFDNDCNGLVDCADPSCAARPPAIPVGKDCSNATATPPTFGKVCDTTSCSCPGGQIAEASCGDNLDNDCDGKTDCSDPDCLGKQCSTTGKKCATTSLTGCNCPGGLTNETDCTNHLDDDCDGLIDCGDPDCTGKQCNATNANYLCTVGTSSICQDSTSLFSVVVTPGSPRIPADGAATTTISAVIKNGTSPIVGVMVTFAVTTGPGSVAPLSSITDGTGKATTVFTAGTLNATSTITATYAGASGSGIVEQPRVGQIKFVSQQFALMGVRFSSFQEANDLTFQVLDSAVGTYPPGLVVNFSHAPVGGSYIGSVANCAGTPLNCTATGVTDSQGFVKVSLHSGTVASVVSVRADATGGGGAQNATASNIAIVGAKASGLHVSIDCSPKNIPAFQNNDCTNSYVNQTINCVAAFADRFNNVLGVATLATFSTEAGAAGPPATTGAGGLANGFVSVKGFSLPVDVDPDAGTGVFEASLAYNAGCGMATHNPRDGLVSIIVSAVGEEGFVDGSNGCPADGVYNAPGTAGCALGENYVDQGEPFLDSNDNGIRDSNEGYVDSNNNGAWNGPNGQWDQNTVVWAETRVVYTGDARANAGPVVSEWFDAGVANPPPPSLPLTAFQVISAHTGMSPTPATSQSFGVYFADPNFNRLPLATAYSVAAIPTGPTVAFTTAPAATVDSLGLTFTQQFCDTLADGGTGVACANACQTAPCHTVSKVISYSYGNYGTAQITAAGTPGPYEVRATSTLNGVTIPVSIFGDVLP